MIDAHIHFSWVPKPADGSPVTAADLLGTIEKGKFADLLGLEKDPLLDIKNLRSAQIIIQGGKEIKGGLK